MLLRQDGSVVEERVNVKKNQYGSFLYMPMFT